MVIVEFLILSGTDNVLWLCGVAPHAISVANLAAAVATGADTVSIVILLVAAVHVAASHTATAGKIVIIIEADGVLNKSLGGGQEGVLGCNQGESHYG